MPVAALGCGAGGGGEELWGSLNPSAQDFSLKSERMNSVASTPHPNELRRHSCQPGLSIIFTPHGAISWIIEYQLVTGPQAFNPRLRSAQSFAKAIICEFFLFFVRAIFDGLSASDKCRFDLIKIVTYFDDDMVKVCHGTAMQQLMFPPQRIRVKILRRLWANIRQFYP